MTEYHITNKADIPHEPLAGKVPSIQSFPSSNSAILPKLRVSFQYRRPNQAFRIATIGSRENVTRGMLVDGEYTSYEIRTCRIVTQSATKVILAPLSYYFANEALLLWALFSLQKYAILYAFCIFPCVYFILIIFVLIIEC